MFLTSVIFYLVWNMLIDSQSLVSIAAFSSFGLLSCQYKRVLVVGRVLKNTDYCGLRTRKWKKY